MEPTTLTCGVDGLPVKVCSLRAWFVFFFLPRALTVEMPPVLEIVLKLTWILFNVIYKLRGELP